MFQVADTTVHVYISVINRLGLEAVRRRSGIGPPAASAALEAAQAAIERDREASLRRGGTWLGSWPDPLAAFYEQVLLFTEAQLSKPAFSEHFGAVSASPGFADPDFVAEQYVLTDRGVLDMALHRRAFVNGVDYTMGALNMERGPERRGVLEAQFLTEAESAMLARFENGNLWAPLAAFGAEEVVPLHRRLAEFCWHVDDGKVLMIWPLDGDENGQAAIVTQAPEKDSLTTKTCPDCAETVKDAANVCRYCGYRFDPQRSG